DVRDWPRWEKKWKELLAFAGLPRWHHTDFIRRIKRQSRSDPGTPWKDGEWLAARLMLCQAFEEIKPICVAATVQRSDYDHFHAIYEIPDDPYYFLLDRVLHRFIQGMFQTPKDSGIAVYCDQDRDEDLVKNLAHWHTNYLHQSDHFGHPEVATRKVVTS